MGHDGKESAAACRRPRRRAHVQRRLEEICCIAGAPASNSISSISYGPTIITESLSQSSIQFLPRRYWNEIKFLWNTTSSDSNTRSSCAKTMRPLRLELCESFLFSVLVYLSLECRWPKHILRSVRKTSEEQHRDNLKLEIDRNKAIKLEETMEPSRAPIRAIISETNCHT